MAEKKNLSLPEKEVALLKKTFKDNEMLLKLIRAVLFGFDVTEVERKTVQDIFANKELLLSFRKKIYPELSKESPIGQITDFWMGTEANIFGASRDTIYQAVQSKQKVLTMLEAGLKSLADSTAPCVDISYNPQSVVDELQISLLARNLYMKSVESGLHIINQIVNHKEKTPEQKALAAEKNSSK